MTLDIAGNTSTPTLNYTSSNLTWFSAGGQNYTLNVNGTNNKARPAYAMNMFGYVSYMHDKPVLSVLLSIGLSTTCVLGIIGNPLVIVAVLLDKTLCQPGNLFIVNLAIADLFVNVIVDPFEVVGFLYGGRYFYDYPQLCELVASICAPACLASMANICAIALNRYVCVCHIAYYRRIFTWRNTIAMCGFIWVWSFGLHLPNHIGWGVNAFHEKYLACTFSIETYSYAVTFVSLGVLVPLTMVIYSYVRIFFAYHKARIRVTAHLHSIPAKTALTITGGAALGRPNAVQPAPVINSDTFPSEVSAAKTVGTAATSPSVQNLGLNAKRTTTTTIEKQNNSLQLPKLYPSGTITEASTAGSGNRTKQQTVQQVAAARSELKRGEDERKLVKTLFLIAIVFLACWGPFALFVLMRQPDSIPTWIFVLSLMMAHVNSTLNWIIYWLTSSIFSHAFNVILHRAWYFITGRRHLIKATFFGDTLAGHSMARPTTNNYHNKQSSAIVSNGGYKSALAGVTNGDKVKTDRR